MPKISGSKFAGTKPHSWGGGNARGLSQAPSKNENNRRTERNVADNLGQLASELTNQRAVIKEF